MTLSLKRSLPIFYSDHVFLRRTIHCPHIAADQYLMALAVSGSDINPLAPSNQLHPRTLFSSSQITTMIIKKQEEANAKIDIAEGSASVRIAMSYHRLGTHLNAL
jgi:hypothetical protein